MTHGACMGANFGIGAMSKAQDHETSEQIPARRQWIIESLEWARALSEPSESVVAWMRWAEMRLNELTGSEA